jgi:choline-phosphate cytidylyltransferase
MKRVITYGSFDLFHEGHYNLLKRVRALGDYVIVGVTTQQYDESRGKLNIVDSLDERIENVKRSGFADKIIVEDHSGQKVEDIQKYGIDIFAIGSDWEGIYDYLKDLCQVIYLERTKNVSSTLLREQRHPIIRIGVIGTGRIASRFVPEAKYVSGITVHSAYNPHPLSAEQFAKRFELHSYTDDFEAFLREVEAVYIASPHETHYEYAKLALERGKHVLCEKPIALEKTQAEKLFDLAASRHLVLLEAIKTAYCPGFAQLIGIARSGAIGRIRDVEACFTRLTAQHMRECQDSAYGGGFLEFGSHTMLPIFKLMGTNYEEVRFDSVLAENGIDVYTKASFRFPEGLALSKSGVGVKSEGQLIIAGTRGYILAKSPWWLTQEFEVRYEDPSKIEKYFVKFLGDGIRYEISDFVYMVNGHQDRSFKLTREESVTMAGVMEAFLTAREGKRQQPDTLTKVSQIPCEGIRSKQRRERQSKGLDEQQNLMPIVRGTPFAGNTSNRLDEQHDLISVKHAHGVRLWAHRGCSYQFPENTLAAFEAACKLEGLTGIELDIQLTKDGEPVVIHDETVDRTTGGSGKVKDYTLRELQALAINGDQRIPTMEEVFQLVTPYSHSKGLLLNIELKNSVERYEGLEEKIVALTDKFDMGNYVIYSSFLPASMEQIHQLRPQAEIGFLSVKLSDCRKAAQWSGMSWSGSYGGAALHPSIDGLDEAAQPVFSVIRAWNSSEPFFGQDRPV